MKIRDKVIGEGRCYVIAECGVNHNGDFNVAREMVERAAEAGADAVKFQKRTLHLNYTEEEMQQPRPGPWGATNGDLKRLLELSPDAHAALSAHARDFGLAYIVSPWDVQALDFMGSICDALKIASARNHRKDILHAVISTGLPIIASTGMSTAAEVAWILGELEERAVDRSAVMACVSAYPCGLDDLNLNRISMLRGNGRGLLPVGYSSHSISPWPALCAVAMGADLIEVHVTKSRALWGTDQAASLEFGALEKLVQEIRDFERARGSWELGVLECEQAPRAKLRR